MEIEEAKRAAEGFHQWTILVADYMESINKSLVSTLIEPSDREECLKGMFLRSVCWLVTLKRLDRPTDLQAIGACNRALLEIVVDMVLLHEDKSDISSARMKWWEKSAMLKSAEALQAFYSAEGLAVPREYEEQMAFIRDEKTKVQEMRLILWPTQNGRHPYRWTGSGSLPPDIRAADKYYGDVIKADLGMSLTEFYETQSRRLNWYVHGSALTGLRGSLVIFHNICGLAFKWSAELAMICTKLILIDFEFAAYHPGLKDQWEELKRHCLVAFGYSVGALELE